MKNSMPSGRTRDCPAEPGPGPAERVADAVTAGELRTQLDRILASACFAKAWRGCHLLRYLVGAIAQPPLRLINEYAIGIDVFRRDPATYSTGEDPIVRVQLGRLRQRLDAYYRGAGQADPLRISLPLGSYVPRIERHAPPSPPSPFALRVDFPMAGATGQHALGWFIAGLHDELRHRLHHQLGARFAGSALPGTRADGPPQPAASHVLECCVRTDGIVVRSSLRLVDLACGSIVWSRQVDQGMAPSIPCQDALAALCCAAVGELAGVRPADA
jgi:TolB-like protein